MPTYTVEIKKSAAKELEAIPLKDRKRISARIQTLAEDPRPHGCEKLTDDDKYRIRQGNYRILYQIFDEAVVVVVVKIANRKEAYKP